MSEARILLPTDKDAILAYAKARLALSVSEPMEREMKSWSARWRVEALEHYLPRGWSFGVFAGAELEGFLLAQPLLFYRGLTQTVWIEHLEFNNREVATRLIDTAYRWARDKHLQCLLVENSGDNAAILSDWPHARPLDDRWIEIRSARLS